MKPRLVSNWPQVKEDNDTITKLINEAIHTYSARKSHLGIDTDKLFLDSKEREMNVINDDNANLITDHKFEDTQIDQSPSESTLQNFEEKDKDSSSDNNKKKSKEDL